MAQPLPWLKPGLFIGGIAPGLSIVTSALRGTLAVDPIAEALNRFGLLALIFVVATLCCSPLKKLFGWTWPMRIRRMLGVFAFGYALAHVLTYALFDQVANLHAIARDILERPFILVGFLAFGLLVPLAATSTNGMVRRLGFVRWQQLHRLIYPAALLVCLHFIWRVKRDLTEPAIYTSIVVALLLVRVALRLRRPVPRAAARSHSNPDPGSPGSG